MLLTKMLQLIDRNPDNLKDWVYTIDCVKSPCSGKNNNPGTKYVCYNLYT